MALGSREVAAEKAASLDRAVTVEPTAVTVETGRRRPCCPLGRVLTLLTLAACCLCLGFVELHRLRQGAEMQRQLVQLQHRLDRLEGDAPQVPRIDSATSVNIDDPTVFRQRRSVAEPLRTADGVPILDGPYGSRHRLPNLGLSLYETLQGQREAPETVPNTAGPADDPSIQPHHRSSAAYNTRFGRVNTNAVIGANDERQPAGAASASTGRRAPVPGELHRRSRAAPVLEARGSPTSFVPPVRGSGRAAAGPHSAQKQPQQQPSPAGCVAAHFEGHVAPLSRTTTSYGGSEGNGRLRNTNLDGMFTDWRPAAWMEEQRCEQNFKLYGGQVTVETSGLYYLYAQINYLEDSDINAFEVQVNARSLAKCIAMEASDLEEKINTCHTGAVTYLNRGDAVSIRDLEPNRYSILLNDRSFFGLVRLSASG